MKILKFKKLLSLFVILAMVLSHTTAYATSDNHVNKISKAETGSQNEIVGSKLVIVPNDEVISGSSIIITAEGATFSFEPTQYEGYLSGQKCTYASAMNMLQDYGRYGADYVISRLLEEGSNLPYLTKVIDDHTIQVNLFPISSSYTGNKYNERVISYHIPLDLTSDGTGDVTVKLDNNDTSVSSGSYKVAVTDLSSALNIEVNGTNRISKVRALNGAEVAFNNSFLIITPKDEVSANSEITITAQGATFNEALTQYKEENLGYTWESIVKQQSSFHIDYVIQDLMYYSNELPYNLTRVSDTELKVTLFQINDGNVGRKYNEKPMSYYIPLDLTANGKENAYITVNGLNTPVSSGKYIVGATSLSSALNVNGNDTNRVNKISSLNSAELKGSYVKITPTEEIPLDTSISITVEGASFKEALSSYSVEIEGSAYTWETVQSFSDGVSEDNLNMFFSKLLEYSNKLPYNLTRVSNNEVKVDLFNVNNNNVRRKYNNIPMAYYIPLDLTGVGTGDVKVKINGLNTPISSGEYVVATNSLATAIKADAGSENSVNKYTNVYKPNQELINAYLKIKPKDAVNKDTKITIAVSGGKLKESLTQYSGYVVGQDYTWESANSILEDEDKNSDYFVRLFFEEYSNCELPYNLERVSDTEMTATLFNLTDNYAGYDFSNNSIFYRIPLEIIANGGEEVKVTVNGLDTVINSDEFVVGAYDASYVLGNVDGDEEVTATDAVYIFSLLKMTEEEFGKAVIYEWYGWYDERADIDGNGKIEIDDFNHLWQKILNDDYVIVSE